MYNSLYRNVVTVCKIPTYAKIYNILSRISPLENIFIIGCSMLQSESLNCAFTMVVVVGASSHIKFASVRN